MGHKKREKKIAREVERRLEEAMRDLASVSAPPVASPGSLRRFEAAKYDRNNAGHWSQMTGQTINASLSGSINDLRNKSEYESANNPLIEGMIGTYTLCCLGSHGPKLRITSSDEEYSKQRQAVWAKWARHAGSNQQLALIDIMRLWIRSLFHAGEFLDQIITVHDAPGAVKMRVLPIHTHRLLTPPEFLGDPEVAMGVRRDLKNRRPTHYYISQPYIFGSFEVYTGEYLEVPYRDIVHGFLMNEEDQVRGVSWLQPSLDPAAELRDYKQSTQDAARAAADWGVYLYTENQDLPAIDMSGAGGFDFKRRQTRAMPPSWKPFMVQPQQPPANWEPFYEALAREVGRPINMPLMMLLLDSSDHNLSSARFDGTLFWKGIGYVQGSLFTPQLDRLEDAVCEEATAAGVLPPAPDDVERSWIGWAKAPQMDPKDEAATERTSLENGTLGYDEACAAHDKNWEEMVDRRAKINERLKSKGLPVIPGIPEKVVASSEKVGEESEGNGKANGKGSRDKNGKDKSLAAFGGR